MLHNRAGAFVSLHEHGELRGCIGTIGPTESCIAREIIQNAISAATRDPRFPPVTPDELEDLEISVDILGEPEPIVSESELDVKKYGVIVRSGYRCGLLLPNLEGVTSVKQQISIAKQKAGICPRQKYSMERFEVVRHV
jgi:AmmeMemoRadiSam system protein A